MHPTARILTALTSIVFVAVLAASCASEGTDIPIGPRRDTPATSSTTLPDVAPLKGLSLELVVSGLDSPVAIAPAPAIEELFVVQRTGRLVTLSSGGASTVLDLTSAIGWENEEQGFLGFAVHPMFPARPMGYAVYTNLDHDVIVSSFAWTGGVFDRSTEHELLIVPQPHKYHQGGGILFGPRGDLWLSFGDGGGIGDPYGNGQNPATLNGTIVRIDVDNGDPYALPPDNPFLERAGARPEVWAYGLRNPWRFTIDGQKLIVVDVGQYEAEEINVADTSAGGVNFGWPVMEGLGCYEAESCDDSGFEPPALAIGRDRTCAVIGGPVYRGTAIPELHSHYVFGDYCVGWVRTTPFIDGAFGEITDWERDLDGLEFITTFGEDLDGEILVVTLGGEVHRIVPVR